MDQIMISDEKDPQLIPIIQNVQVGEYLRRYCDLRKKLSQWALKELSLYCTNKEEQKYLEQLSTKKGKKEFNKVFTDR